MSIKSELKEDVLKFDKPLLGSDQILLTEKQEFHVHLSVLALSSSAFRAMFDDDCQESVSSKVVLPTKKNAHSITFLSLLYSR